MGITGAELNRKWNPIQEKHDGSGEFTRVETVTNSSRLVFTNLPASGSQGVSAVSEPMTLSEKNCAQLDANGLILSAAERSKS